MIPFVTVCAGIVLVCLVLLDAGRSPRATTSLYELRRLKAEKDARAAATLRREELLAQASLLKAPLRGLLLIALALLLVYAFGWARGSLAAVVAVLLYGRALNVSVIRKLANERYAKWEGAILRGVETYERPLRRLGGRSSLSQPTAPLGSHEELLHLLEVSHIFSDEDKKMLAGALRFSGQTVAECMVRKGAVVMVQPDELLGPLVLDDLHKTKHEIFPVQKGDDIVGLLDIRDHVALRRKESVYVRDVMHTGVVRINQTEPLDEALRVLVAAKQPYLVVTDDDGRMVGLLGLGDVIRTLTGWTRR